jgi:hypothetical protein
MAQALSFKSNQEGQEIPCYIGSSIHLQRNRPMELTPLYDCYSIYRRYPAYKRVTGIAMLVARRLPVLNGFVTKTISAEVLDYLKYWMRARQMMRLTLVLDSTLPSDHKEQTICSPTLEELQQVQNLLHGTAIAIIMEENDWLQQSYTVLTSFSEDYLVCEVVGPGFEVSDLTRGFITPHERFVFRRKDSDDGYRDLGPADLYLHTIITGESYLQSVELRYSKVYHRYVRPGHTVRIEALTEEQKRDVELLLEVHRSPLLNHRVRYIPINWDKLCELYGYISELDVFYPDEFKGKVVAASFLKKQGLIFWGTFGSGQLKMLDH